MKNLVLMFLFVGAYDAFAGAEVSKVADSITVVGDVKNVVERGFDKCSFARTLTRYNTLRTVIRETGFGGNIEECERGLKKIANNAAAGSAVCMSIPAAAPYAAALLPTIGVIKLLQEFGAAWCVCADVYG